MSDYNLVVLKLSGEAFSGIDKPFDLSIIEASARAIADALRKDKHLKPLICCGGGNIARARDMNTIVHTCSDSIGRLGSLQNAILLEHYLSMNGISSTLYSGCDSGEFADTYTFRSAIKVLPHCDAMLFGAGREALCSTDTTAAVKLADFGAKRFLKASNVNGICEKDPRFFPDSKVISNITYAEYDDIHSTVMDAQAIAILSRCHAEVDVFKFTPDNIERVLLGEHIGTYLHD